MSDSKSFPYPLQTGVLDHFVHPREGHIFERPVSHEGDVVTANAYIACRFHRGYWSPSDFESAPAAFLERFNALPWARFHGLPDEWQPLDDVRGNLYKYATIEPWTTKDTCAPSPVWRVGGSFLARLSHLQLIARLPRCEIHLGVMGREAPLLFRFNGGMGMLAPDKRLTSASFSIFEPQTYYDGTPKTRPSRKPPTAEQVRKAQEFHAGEAALEAREFTYE